MKKEEIIKSFERKYPKGTDVKCLENGAVLRVFGNYDIYLGCVGCEDEKGEGIILGCLNDGRYAEIVPQETPLEICKRMFPEGTYFTSIYGRKSVSTGNFRLNHYNSVVSLGVDENSIVYCGIDKKYATPESNLDKARRLYPSGTKFQGQSSIFVSSGDFVEHEYGIYKSRKDGSGHGFGLVFNKTNNKWSKIIKPVFGISSYMQNRVINWALSKGLIDDKNSKAQFVKIIEEVGEMGGAMLKGNIKDEKDGLGDTIVTLIIYAAQRGLNLSECLEIALTEIEGRTGKMVDGSFVKD